MWFPTQLVLTSIAKKDKSPHLSLSMLTSRILHEHPKSFLAVCRTGLGPSSGTYLRNFQWALHSSSSEVYAPRARPHSPSSLGANSSMRKICFLIFYEKSLLIWVGPPSSAITLRTFTLPSLVTGETFPWKIKRITNQLVCFEALRPSMQPEVHLLDAYTCSPSCWSAMMSYGISWFCMIPMFSMGFPIQQGSLKPTLPHHPFV